MGDTVALDLGQDLVKVKLKQFYGIEINDFAVSVAKQLSDCRKSNAGRYQGYRI